MLLTDIIVQIEESIHHSKQIILKYVSENTTNDNKLLFIKKRI